MRRDVYRKRKTGNILQSLAILFVMAALSALLGYIIAGPQGLVVAVILAAVFMLIGPSVSPSIILKMYRARKLAYEEAPGLYSIVTELAQRGNLPRPPALYYVPSRIMNAFTVGKKNDAVIALTDGIIRNLTWRELTGVLAHEMSHIIHNDLRIMGLADIMSRFTHALSTAGQILLVLYLPVMFVSGKFISLSIVLLLVGAPFISMMLQMALSRTREYDADLQTARLTGDPEGLAMALKKIEHVPKGFMDLFIFPGRKEPVPSSLRSHPETEKRVKRLIELTQRREPVNYPAGNILPPKYGEVTRDPAKRIFGLWH